MLKIYSPRQAPAHITVVLANKQFADVACDDTRECSARQQGRRSRRPFHAGQHVPPQGPAHGPREGVPSPLASMFAHASAHRVAQGFAHLAQMPPREPPDSRDPPHDPRDSDNTCPRRAFHGMHRGPFNQPGPPAWAAAQRQAEGVPDSGPQHTDSRVRQTVDKSLGAAKAVATAAGDLAFQLLGTAADLVENAIRAPSRPSAVPEAQAQAPAAPAPDSATAPEETAPAERPTAELVQELTFPNGAKALCGASFVKTWLVRNSGSEPWPENMELQLRGNDYFFSNGGKSLSPYRLPPGESRELSINLIAPTRPGRYTEHFSLRDSSTGHSFGPPLTVDIAVDDFEEDWDDLAGHDSDDQPPVAARVEAEADADADADTGAATGQEKEEARWETELHILADMGFLDRERIIPILKISIVSPVSECPELNGQPKQEEIQHAVTMLLN